MVKKDRKRQKELQKRLAQGQSQPKQQQELDVAQAALARELGDPQRLAQHLNAFAQLALISPDLHPVRFPARPFVEAMIAFVPPEEGDATAKAVAMRRDLLPRFATPELRAKLGQVLEAAQDAAQNAGQLVAIMAARALATSAATDGDRVDHPFWNLVFDLTISEAVLSGHFFIRFVLSTIQPDAKQAGAAFAKALADAELSRTLDELGLDETDPGALARRYVDLVLEEEPYHLQFDSILHLAGLHLGLAETVGRVLTRYGASARARELITRLYEGAYAADVTETLAKELRVWFGKHLRALQDPASLGEELSAEQLERERGRALIAYLALSVLPPASNHWLRAIHVQSLVRARTLAGEMEAPFVEKLWSEPTDTFSLEEYERFLRERGDVNRGKRVRTYLDHMKAHRDELKRSLAEVQAEGEQPAPQGASPSDGSET